MYSRLIEYLETFKFLLDNQFGFRKWHSSYMALMQLMDQLIKSLEKGDTVIGVFLDFSKACDTVDHDILLKKMEHYGIRGCALSWFKSYLANRKQFVTYNGVSSTTKNIRCGVPQGSILGPLLFLIYINDLYSACKHTTAILFADDSNLFKSGTDINAMERDINDELRNISVWLKVNKLSLNVDKTYYMILSRKKTERKNKTLRINEQMISEVRKIKFLGVMLDNKVNWKDHINYISGKVSRGIGMILKARRYLTKKALMTLYYSFIYPYLTYCNHIRGSTYQTNLMKLQKLQNRIIRIICNTNRRDHVRPLYKATGLLQLGDINKYLTCRFMFRVCNNHVPRVFHSFFKRNREFHNYETRTANHFHVPPVRTDLAKTGIRYRGATLWNAILDHGLDHELSEAIFVKFLKKIVDVLPWQQLRNSFNFHNWHWWSS